MLNFIMRLVLIPLAFFGMCVLGVIMFAGAAIDWLDPRRQIKDLDDWDVRK